ncbi:MAG: ATP-binding cassette domain-containing protein [Desulfonatronovibrionaceae bacterium]
MSDSALLVLENVGHGFGRGAVFADVGLVLEPGQVILVVGPNAAGKSTLLKMAAGIIRPDSGRIILKKGIRVGYLAHESFIYPGLSALENLKFWSGFYGERHSEQDILEVLRRVGLERSAWEPAESFSRGMAQRLSLARVLLLTPGVVLLDEPGSGLDSDSRRILAREVRLARERGAGIIWVSHDLGRDASEADRILALGEGRQLFWGRFEDYSPEARDA